MKWLASKGKQILLRLNWTDSDVPGKSKLSDFAVRATIIATGGLCFILAVSIALWSAKGGGGDVGFWIHLDAILIAGLSASSLFSWWLYRSRQALRSTIDTLAETETDLRRSQARLTRAQEVARLGQWERDFATRELWWSDEVYRLFGLDPTVTASPNEAFAQTVPPDDQERVVDAVKLAVQQRSEFDVVHRVVFPNGEERHLNERGEIIYDANGAPERIIGFSIDVTDQIKAEQALQETQGIYESLVKMAPVAIYVQSDINGTVAFSNEAGARLMEADSAEDLVGRSLIEHLGPEFQEQARQRNRAVLEGRLVAPVVEGVMVRRDGSEIDVERAVVATRFRGKPALQSVVHDITDRKRAEREILNLNATLENRVRERTEELSRANEQLTETLGALRVAQQQMVQSEKLAALGTLMAGVAHEMNNPLMGISNYVDYAHRHIEHERGKAALEKAHRAIHRVSDIVKNMLSYARPASTDLSEIDVTDVIEDTLELARLDLQGKLVEIELDIADDIPKVIARSDSLHQVLLNLIFNARDAVMTEEIRRVTIRCHQTGQDVRIEVEDSGPGVPEEIRARIFDPFFSTKAPGSGTGMGLAVSKQIVEAFGGTLELKNQPDSGACFTISVPVSG